MCSCILWCLLFLTNQALSCMKKKKKIGGWWHTKRGCIVVPYDVYFTSSIKLSPAWKKKKKKKINPNIVIPPNHHWTSRYNTRRPPLCFTVLRCVAWRLHTWIHTHVRQFMCECCAYGKVIHTYIHTYINGSCVTIYINLTTYELLTGHKQNPKNTKTS